MRPKLGKLYPLNEFRPEWMECFGSREPHQYALPTEVVCFEARMVVPTMARAYVTHWYAYRGLAVSYNWLYHLYEVKGEQFPGTYKAAEQVWMVEVWENNGDDGHIENCLVGVRFVPYGALCFTRNNWRTNEPTSLPEATQWQPFDDDEEASR